MTKKDETQAARITILGSGTCEPSLSRSSCAVLLETGAANILLDIGAGTMHRLLARGVSVFEITDIFISHFHPDHTGELASFLFANKYSHSWKRTRPLRLVGGKGFKDFFERLRGVYGEWIQLFPDRNDWIAEWSEPEMRGADFRVTAQSVVHRPESLAYRFRLTDGVDIVYSGDAEFSPSLVSIAREADVFICECAMPDEQKMAGHLTPSLAGEIAAKANVRMLVLTHFYPECDSVDIAAQCRKTYAGPLVLAKDLMTIPLHRPV